MFLKECYQKKMKKKYGKDKISVLVLIRILKKSKGYKKFMFVSCSLIFDNRLEL